MHAALRQRCRPAVCCETEGEPHFKVSSTSRVYALRQLSSGFERAVCGECVCVRGPQRFSNDRVVFWKLAPVITQDPSVLWFARRQPRVSLSLCRFFTKYIDARREKDMNPRTGANTKHCHSFFFPLIPSTPLLFLSLFSSGSSFLSHTPKTAFSLLKQISCKCSPFDFFSTSREKFPRKPVSFVAGVLSGSHWSAGNREHKGSRAAFKWGWEVVGLWRWEPVQPENHSQFHMWLSVGT